jgi:hypothetical protein
VKTAPAKAKHVFSPHYLQLDFSNNRKISKALLGAAMQAFSLTFN